MKISIVTVVYNNEDTIEQAILSVINQTYPDIEYILIDGQSTDNTLNIINKYKNQVSKIISEPDNGIYDAMNKGLKKCTGDLVGILNSDDFYKNQDVLSKVVKTFQEKNVDSVYGNLLYVDPENTEVVNRRWVSGEFKRSKFRYGWMPPHPTFFVKKKVYDEYGLFNLEIKSAADYEIMLRFLYKNKISTAYIDEVITIMRDGGNSNQSLRHRLKANKEDFRSWKINGIKPNLFFRFLKPMRKVKQYIIK